MLAGRQQLQRFVHRVLVHNDFQLYALREFDPGARPTYFYMLYYGNTTDPAVLVRPIDWERRAAANPPFDEIAKTLPPLKRRVYTMFDLLQDAGRAYRKMWP